MFSFWVQFSFPNTFSHISLLWLTCVKLYPFFLNYLKSFVNLCVYTCVINAVTWQWDHIQKTSMWDEWEIFSYTDMCSEVTMQIFWIHHNIIGKEEIQADIYNTYRHLLCFFSVLRRCTIWYNFEFVNDCQVIVISYLYIRMPWWW